MYYYLRICQQGLPFSILNHFPTLIGGAGNSKYFEKIYLYCLYQIKSNVTKMYNDMLIKNKYLFIYTSYMCLYFAFRFRLFFILQILILDLFQSNKCCLVINTNRSFLLQLVLYVFQYGKY